MLDADLDPFEDFGPNVQFQEDVEGDDEEVLLFYRNCPDPLCVILLFTWFARAWFLISYLVLVDVLDSTVHTVRF